jgi:hypothetical protein
MATTLLALSVAILIMVGLVVGARRPRIPMPVTFKNLKELRTVSGVAKWANKQLGDNRNSRSRLQHSVFLFAYNSTWMARIPVEELAILSPFIDLIIEGKGPPPILSAEYEDERPATLKRFKERMQAEGRWPRSPRSDPDPPWVGH